MGLSVCSREPPELILSWKDNTEKLDGRGRAACGGRCSFQTSFEGEHTDKFLGWDGLSFPIFVAAALTRCQDFLHACPGHASLPQSFVLARCSQEPSLGVPHGMLAVPSVVFVPYVCVSVPAFLNEKWEYGPPMLLLLLLLLMSTPHSSLWMDCMDSIGKGAFVWVESIIHLLHSCPRGSGGGSVVQFWHGVNAPGTSAFTFPPSAPSLSIPHRLRLSFSLLDINGEIVVALAMISCFHLLLDITLDHAVLLWILCFTALHWWTTADSHSLSSTSWHKYAQTNFFIPSLTNLVLMRLTQLRGNVACFLALEDLQTLHKLCLNVITFRENRMIAIH